ncbi:hypothetical protein HNO89_002621 [Sporosarcina luteola]|nr:hypothetical protein [Sporosarcina luteola]
MAKSITMALSLLALILLTIIGNFISINGSTTTEITNRIPVLFIPATYVFIIWGVIYGMLFYWIYKGFSDKRLKGRRTIFFTAACASQIAWILLWHFELFSLALLSKSILLMLLLLLYFTYPKRENTAAGRIPIAMFFAWASFGWITNFSYLLMLHEWNGWGLSDPLWTVIYMTVATAGALHFMYHHKDYVFNLVFIWSFIGIAVKNGTEELFVSAAAIFLTAVLAASFLFVREMKRE